ncbi:hypothetical protein QFZ94_008344 [Paraburkholderia sp. JPY465]|uniref:hypothetical protein n=1 Tax=Paraburkholderia sp. JPY465 TaxID=3042285 RepID=UPI003D21BEE5
MKKLVSRQNVLDFSSFFSKLHFYKKISVGHSSSMTREFFSGTSEEATASEFIDFLVESRDFDERFPLNERWMWC